MTYSDGYIDDEVQLIVEIADNMGFKPEIITDLIKIMEQEAGSLSSSNLDSGGGMAAWGC